MLHQELKKSDSFYFLFLVMEMKECFSVLSAVMVEAYDDNTLSQYLQMVVDELYEKVRREGEFEVRIIVKRLEGSYKLIVKEGDTNG